MNCLIHSRELDRSNISYSNGANVDTPRGLITEGVSFPTSLHRVPHAVRNRKSSPQYLPYGNKSFITVCSFHLCASNKLFIQLFVQDEVVSLFYHHFCLRYCDESLLLFQCLLINQLIFPSSGGGTEL